MAVVDGGALGLGANLVGKMNGGVAGEREVQQLTVRYWGAVLFELGANLRAVAEHREGRLVLRFVVYQALIDDLCRLDPSPAAIHRLNDAIAWLHRRDESTQPKAGCRYVPPGSGAPTDELADLDAIYEWLCDQARIAGERAHGRDAWEHLEPHIVPPDRRSLSTLSSRERLRRQRAAAERRQHDATLHPDPTRRHRGRYHYSEFEDSD